MEDNKLRAVSYCLYTSSNPDWEIVGNYEETEFDTMLEDAKNGKFDIILTKSISQFSENVVELLTILGSSDRSAFTEVVVAGYRGKEKTYPKEIAEFAIACADSLIEGLKRK